MSKAHMVRIERDNSLKELTISLSTKLATELGLFETRTVIVSFGLLSRQIRLSIRNGSDRRVNVSSSTISALKLPTGVQVHIKASGNGFELGPVMGIFAPRFGVGRFGPHTPYIRSLVRMSRRMGIWTYVFSATDINFENHTTSGYTLVGGHWRKGTFPLPNVCYDRIPSRRIDAQSKVKHAKETLRNTPGIICFNDRFMDKWKVYKELEGNKTADQYLPRTKRYEGSEDLRSFLSKYRRVFLKPSGGSQGRGIIKVVKEGPDRYSYTIAGRGRGSSHSCEGLARKLSSQTTGRRYIIQQGLPLATAAGRHFDIRLLMQKDSTGKWLVTKAYARIAAPGRITSNISTGAEGIGMTRALRRTFGKRAKSIASRVKGAGLKLAPVVERQLGQNLGELGLDMGVDKNGHVWLIEVNSKPFRHMTTETGSKLEIVKSVIRPLSYTLGIAGFHKMKVQPVWSEGMEEGNSDSETAI